MSDEPEWIEVQVTAHIYDWQPNERRQVNIKDTETQGLVNAGLLVIVDEETRKSLPAPKTTTSPGGCGCGK